MGMQYKTSHKMYTAWNYQKEIEDLNNASVQGWQLMHGGCFSSKFVKNPDVRYIYQLDYQQVEDMGRYIETFREQGWEYVNSTFNGWHYFRKLYDPALPETAYEIFTDKESLQEMNGRWARFALVLSAAIGLFFVFSAVRLILEPCWPALVYTLTFLVESLVLLRGGLIMRSPTASRSRKGDGALFAVFLLVIIFGCGAGITLSGLRADFSTEQNSVADGPISDNRWVDFNVRYADNYYLDLEIDADEPLTFAIVDAAGETVYSETAAEFEEEDIRIHLDKGQYWYSLSTPGGRFDVKCGLD